MQKSVVPYSDTQGYSTLFQSFIHEPDRLEHFFPVRDTAARGRDILARRFPRRRLADLLARQNAAWQAGPETLAAIERLRRDDALTVMAGHQACLFGGPYLILLKALGIIKKAHDTEERLGLPVVPIFWLAADDADVDEISFTHLFDSHGDAVRLSVAFPDATEPPPVGALSLDESVSRAIDELSALLPDNDFKSAALAPIEKFWRPGRPVVDAFARYLHYLVGRFGLVLFNPYDAEFKTLTPDFMTQVIAKHQQTKQALADCAARLDDQGYHLQVRKSETALHLFRHTPERRPIHTDGEVYKIGDQTISAEELTAAIAANPLDFSTDVFTRPLMQSCLFPTVGFMGGPAEIAYWAQIMPLFEIFCLTPPEVHARPSATILERRLENVMDENDISYHSIGDDFERLVGEKLQSDFPADLNADLTGFGETVRAEIERLQAALIAFDAQLQPMIVRTGEKMDYLVTELHKKAVAAHKKKHKNQRDRLLKLKTQLFPYGAAAERSIAPVYFMSRYGEAVIDYLYARLDLSARGHQLVSLAEYDG